MCTFDCQQIPAVRQQQQPRRQLIADGDVNHDSDTKKANITSTPVRAGGDHDDDETTIAPHAASYRIPCVDMTFRQKVLVCCIATTLRLARRSLSRNVSVAGSVAKCCLAILFSRRTMWIALLRIVRHDMPASLGAYVMLWYHAIDDSSCRETPSIQRLWCMDLICNQEPPLDPL